MLTLIRSLALVALLALPLGPLPTPATAQDKPAPTATQREAELDAAFKAVMQAAKPGPGDIPLINQATLHLPAGYIFVPKEQGARLMHAFGNRTGEQFVGLILSTTELQWFMTLDYVKSGYVKDDDAKDWKPDTLLTSLRDGTEAGNADRIERGFPPVEVTGWVEPPVYSSETHRLVWSAMLRRKGETTGGTVNYNTYALGREGYFELNLIGGADVVVREKERAKTMLAALEYSPGKSYADFQPGTDRVAEYGLAALVAGVAAKKLGLFALIGVMIAKFGKVIAIGAIAAFALLARLFGGKKTA